MTSHTAQPAILSEINRLANHPFSASIRKPTSPPSFGNFTRVSILARGFSEPASRSPTASNGRFQVSGLSLNSPVLRESFHRPSIKSGPFLTDRIAPNCLTARESFISSAGPIYSLKIPSRYSFAGRDGTENPMPEHRPEVAMLPGESGLSGSSFAAVQRWVHDLKRFFTHSKKERDHIIGNRRSTKEEIADALPSSHIKRSAQESDSPPASILFRRSMPWARGAKQGLEFSASASSLDPFEQILHRMAGLEDGIPDALFTFSRPVTGGNYWCPPLQERTLDFLALR